MDADYLLGGGSDGKTVEVLGDTVTDTVPNEAISIIADIKLTEKIIVIRGRRFNDMRN